MNAITSVLLAILFSSFTVIEASDCFIAGPYVLHVSHDSAKIIWISPPNNNSGIVEITPAIDGNVSLISSEVSVPRFHYSENLSIELDDVRQMVTIENLDPYSDYHYTARCEEGGDTRSGVFRTALMPGDDSQPFEFVVTADGHAHHGRNSDYYPVAQAIGNLRPDFLVHAGDMSSGYGYDWDYWLGYFEAAKPYHEQMAYWPVPGGHDIRPSRNFRALFGFNDPEGEPAEEDELSTYYSFTYGNLLVIALDWDYLSPDHTGQIEWMQQQIADSDADWIIVVVHDSVFSVGSRQLMTSRRHHQLARASEESGVDIVIFGHDHVNERSLPMGPEGSKPVTYVSIHSGGGHRSVRPSPITTGGIGKQAHAFALFQIDGNTLVKETRDADGTVLDRLELVKGSDGIYQEVVMKKALSMQMALDIAYIYTGNDYSEFGSTSVREDLYARFLSTPRAGEEVELRLNVSNFPRSSKFVIYEQNDSSQWQVEYQEIEVTNEYVELTIRAPDNLERSRPISPPLRLSVNAMIDGRTYETAPLEPTIQYEPEKLTPPETVYPNNGMTGVPVRPVFEWLSVSGAMEYHFQLTATSFIDESNILIDEVMKQTKLGLENSLETHESYRWRVRAINEVEDGPWAIAGTFTTSRESSTEGRLQGHIPDSFKLNQNYPNPYNPSTKINFDLPVEAHVDIRVFDVIGREVAMLKNKIKLPGSHSIDFNSENLSSGIYICRLKAKPIGGNSAHGVEQFQSMTLIK